ncbi:MAG: RecX family transcriptional regulator [bacterium]|nr:RecX family transcriptional regulator [bacterium]
MGVITSLEVQKRNKERVNVHLDGEYAFSLSLIEAAKLKKGQVLSDADIASLKGDDDVVRAVERALRFLGYRPRSIAEVRRNLQEHDTPESVIETALERLIAMGYLDDEAFVRFWVENRTAFKPLGPKALRYELRQKGIADSIIQAALETLDAEDSAYRAAHPRAVRLRGLTRREFQHKLSAFLQRRGFSYEDSRDAIEQLTQEMGADDSGFFADNADDENSDFLN